MDSELEKKLQKKAVALLSRRAYSRGEIRQKLLKIADEPMVEIVLDRLEQLKLLNDLDYAYNFAFYRIGREGWGPEKIRRALYNRQVSDSNIATALDQIRSLVGDHYALADYLKKYFGKKGMPEDLNSARNLVSHLRRRGYHRNSIISVLKNMLPSELMRYFETGD
ncbi:MAG: regulatory protein RecX [Acidobacteria bacterium]|nr:regulatory protein RecX [Acidobacteriota bacterium]